MNAKPERQQLRYTCHSFSIKIDLCPDSEIFRFRVESFRAPHPTLKLPIHYDLRWDFQMLGNTYGAYLVLSKGKVIPTVVFQEGMTRAVLMINPDSTKWSMYHRGFDLYYFLCKAISSFGSQLKETVTTIALDEKEKLNSSEQQTPAQKSWKNEVDFFAYREPGLTLGELDGWELSRQMREAKNRNRD